MYTPKQRQTVLEMGKWLASKSWDIFSTITYRYDIKAKIKYDINYHLKSKSLIGDHVKHEPYKEGASIYVSKFICDDNINWNIIENNC